jgi:hypothetical protein
LGRVIAPLSVNARGANFMPVKRRIQPERSFAYANTRTGRRPRVFAAADVERVRLYGERSRGMRSSYPLMVGLGLVAWAALLFVVIEVGRAVSMW